MLQYDNITESLGVNSRLQLEYKPGAKMFLVVNQGYLDERTGLVMKEFEVVTKIGAFLVFNQFTRQPFFFSFTGRPAICQA